MDNIIEKINANVNGFYGTMEEIEDFLSDLFLDKCEIFGDVQEAFDDLNNDIGDNILSNHFCYMLSDGGERELSIENITSNMISCIHTRFNDITSIEDLECFLNRRIEKCMGDVGCDAKTALSLELEDFPSDYAWEDYISIYIPEGNPRIEYVVI